MTLGVRHFFVKGEAYTDFHPSSIRQNKFVERAMHSGLQGCACVLMASTAWAHVGAAQQPAYPIEARLVSTLDARALKVGDQVLLTSIRDWKDGDCHVTQGATLHGQVVAAASGHGVKHENFALAFTYPCSEIGTFPIRWIALLAPDPDLMKGVHDNPGNVRSLRSESFGEGTNAPSTSSQTSKDPSGRGQSVRASFLGRRASRSGGQTSGSGPRRRCLADSAHQVASRRGTATKLYCLDIFGSSVPGFRHRVCPFGGSSYSSCSRREGRRGVRGSDPKKG